MSPAKTPEPIEMPFGFTIWVDPWNRVLDRGPDPPREGTIFRGKGCKSAVICAKPAKPIEMSFELWAQMGPTNRVLDGSPETLRDVTMASNFGTKIDITGFSRTIATWQLVMEWGLSGRPTDCRYC